MKTIYDQQTLCLFSRCSSLPRENPRRSNAAGAVRKPTLKMLNAENPRSKIAPRVKAVHLSLPPPRIPLTIKTSSVTPRAPMRICTMPMRLVNSPHLAHPMPKAAKSMMHPTTKISANPRSFVSALLYFFLNHPFRLG